jgi:O-antigen ligase
MFLFYWLIAIMPLEQHDLWGRVLFGTVTIIKLLGIAVFLYALGYCCSRGRMPSLGNPIACSVLLFIGFQFGNYFFHVHDLQNGLIGYSHVISILILFISVVILVDSRLRLHRSLLVATGAMAFISVHAIREWQVYGRGLSGYRPGGMMADSNYYALAAGLWMPLTFLWSMNRDRPKWERVFCLVCLITALIGSTLAASRGGFLGLGLAFGWVIWNSPKRVRNLVMAGVLILPISFWSPVSPLRRFRDPSAGDKEAQNARLVAWRAGWRMIEAHPLIGVGLQNFKPEMLRYRQPDEQIDSLAHNTYIELTAELGVFGCLAFTGVFATAFVRLERLRRRAIVYRRRYLAHTALGLQAGIISFLVSAVFLSAWWDKMTWLLISICVCFERMGLASLREAAARSRPVHALRSIIGAPIPQPVFSSAERPARDPSAEMAATASAASRLHGNFGRQAPGEPARP